MTDSQPRKSPLDGMSQFLIRIFAVHIHNKTANIMENSTTTKYLSHKVKDLSLADWGRKEIHLAEAEMPGLM